MIRAAFGYTILAALANVAGAAAVTWRARWTVPALEKMVALSAGFMVSVALLDLAPQAIEQHGAGAGPLILIGFLLVHLTQHTLVPHFHFGEEVHEVTKAVSISALAGLLLHTFVDGVAITSGFEVAQRWDSSCSSRFFCTSFPRGSRSPASFSHRERQGVELCWPEARSDWRRSSVDFHGVLRDAGKVWARARSWRQPLCRGFEPRPRVPGQARLEASGELFSGLRAVFAGAESDRAVPVTKVPVHC